MKKAAIMMLLIAACFCFCSYMNADAGADQSEESVIRDEEAVRNLVEDLGSKLKSVPLLAPKDVFSQSIEESYTGLVAPALLKEWQEDPENAPGRMVSSPWPESIEIVSLRELAQDTYEVRGEIIEMTSEKMAEGGFAAKRPITLIIKRTDGKWLVHELALGEYNQYSEKDK